MSRGLSASYYFKKKIKKSLIKDIKILLKKKNKQTKNKNIVVNDMKITQKIKNKN